MLNNADNDSCLPVWYRSLSILRTFFSSAAASSVCTVHV